MPRLGWAWPNAPAHRGRCGGLGGACVVDDSSSWPAVGCQSGCRKVRVLAGCGYSFFFSSNFVMSSTSDPLSSASEPLPFSAEQLAWLQASFTARTASTGTSADAGGGLPALVPETPETSTGDSASGMCRRVNNVCWCVKPCQLHYTGGRG